MGRLYSVFALGRWWEPRDGSGTVGIDELDFCRGGGALLGAASTMTGSPAELLRGISLDGRIGMS
jgi:hypothetical protein